MENPVEHVRRAPAIPLLLLVVSWYNPGSMVYEYLCKRCAHEWEQHQTTSEPCDKCPSCGEGPVQRLISRTSFVLQGGGWYRDGYSSSTM